ncbi:MAG: GNVR domain-containing protein [Candidatus Melainabacteria bacterium]|nr:GNVR domain-containing protein [Candidatus Melainabacteria bacterium]
MNPRSSSHPSHPLPPEAGIAHHPRQGAGKAPQAGGQGWLSNLMATLGWQSPEARYLRSFTGSLSQPKTTSVRVDRTLTHSTSKQGAFPLSESPMTVDLTTRYTTTHSYQSTFHPKLVQSFEEAVNPAEHSLTDETTAKTSQSVASPLVDNDNTQAQPSASSSSDRYPLSHQTRRRPVGDTLAASSDAADPTPALETLLPEAALSPADSPTPLAQSLTIAPVVEANTTPARPDIDFELDKAFGTEETRPPIAPPTVPADEATPENALPQMFQAERTGTERIGADQSTEANGEPVAPEAASEMGYHAEPSLLETLHRMLHASHELREHHWDEGTADQEWSHTTEATFTATRRTPEGATSTRYMTDPRTGQPSSNPTPSHASADRALHEASVQVSKNTSLTTTVSIHSPTAARSATPLSGWDMSASAATADQNGLNNGFNQATAKPSRPSASKPKSILAILWREKFWVAAVSLFVWCFTLGYGLFIHKPSYVSESVVMIKDSAVTARYLTDAPYQTTSSSSANPVVNTQGLLRTKSVSDAVYEYFVAHYPSVLQAQKINNAREWAAFFGDGSRFIKSKNIPGSDLIQISFAWPNPEVAQQALSEALKAFQQASLALNRTEQITRGAFLDKKVADIRKRLGEVRAEKSAYMKKHGQVNINWETQEMARQRLELQMRISQTRAFAQGKEAEYRRYQEMVKLSPSESLTATAVGQNATMAKLQDRLYDLTQTHERLSATLTDTNPKVQELQAQINQAKADIETEMKRTLGESGKAPSRVVADVTGGEVIERMASTYADSSRLKNELNTLQASYNKIEAQAKALPEVQAKLMAYEQEERGLSTALDSLNQKELEAQMKVAETLSNVFIVDPPRTPAKPQFPAQSHVIVLGLLAGLMLGLGAALVKHQVGEWVDGLEEEADDDRSSYPQMPPPSLANNLNYNALPATAGAEANRLPALATTSQLPHEGGLLTATGHSRGVSSGGLDATRPEAAEVSPAHHSYSTRENTVANPRSVQTPVAAGW